MSSARYPTLVCALLLVGACAGTGDPPALPDATRFVPGAITLPREPPEDALLAPVREALQTAPLVTLPPPEAVPMLFEPHGKAGTRPPRPRRTDNPVSAAERGALLTPSRGGYADATSAILRFPYKVGAVYLITSSPAHPTTVLLPIGLRLAVPPSLSEEWDVGFAESGTGEERQEAIIVRPTVAGLEATTPLLTKSGHLLLCRLKSQEKAAVLAVTWELPLVQVVTAAGSAPAAPKGPVIHLARLHTQYTIEPGKVPVNWMPAEVYDDGNVSVVRFTELKHTAAPALFALGPDGTKPLPLEYTTYAVPGHPEKGEFYVTRGLYARLQLRDGAGGVVTIIRLPTPEPPYTEVRHETR